LARKAGVQYDEEFAKARAEALETTDNATPSPTPARHSENKPRLAEGLAVADFDLLVACYIQRMREPREEAAKDQRSYEQYLMYLRGVVADCKEYLKTDEHPLEDVTRPLWQVEAQLLIELGFVEFVKASPGSRVFHELTDSGRVEPVQRPARQPYP